MYAENENTINNEDVKKFLEEDNRNKSSARPKPPITKNPWRTRGKGGDVFKFNLNTPVKWENWGFIPDDVKQIYLNHIAERVGRVDIVCFTDMWGIGEKEAKAELKRLGHKFGPGQYRKEVLRRFYVTYGVTPSRPFSGPAPSDIDDNTSVDKIDITPTHTKEQKGTGQKAKTKSTKKDASSVKNKNTEIAINPKVLGLKDVQISCTINSSQIMELIKSLGLENQEIKICIGKA